MLKLYKKKQKPDNKKSFWFRKKVTGMIIRAFISDRHSAISKWMKGDCPKRYPDVSYPHSANFVPNPLDDSYPTNYDTKYSKQS